MIRDETTIIEKSQEIEEDVPNSEINDINAASISSTTVTKNNKSKLEKFFPMLKFNTSTGSFILGLVLNIVFTFVSAIIFVIIAVIISAIIALIPIIGLIINAILIPIDFIIGLLIGSYWFASFITQIVMFCMKNKNK